MRCANQYYLHNLKNVKKTHGRVCFSKVASCIFHGCFIQMVPNAQSISIQLLSRGASKTTTKSKMELSLKNDNGESFTFATESPTLDSTKSQIRPRCICQKIKKNKRNDKITQALLIYRETRQPVSTGRMREKHPPAEERHFKQRYLLFYLNVHSSTDATIQPAIKSHHLISPQMERWSGLKCINLTCTENVIQAQLKMAVGSHFIILFLKVSMLFRFFISLGTMPKTFAAKYLRELIPKCSEFIFGLVKSV